MIHSVHHNLNCHTIQVDTQLLQCRHHWGGGLESEHLPPPPPPYQPVKVVIDKEEDLYGLHN